MARGCSRITGGILRLLTLGLLLSRLMSLTALREGVDGLDRGCWEVNVRLKDAGVVA